MDLPSLLAGIAVPAAVHSAIRDLLSRKAIATEAGMTPRVPAVERFLAESLAMQAPRPAAWDREAARVAADTLFQAAVLGQPFPVVSSHTDRR